MNSDYIQEYPPEKRIYFNNASTSRMPKSSIKAMTDFLDKYNELGPDSEESSVYVKEILTNVRVGISKIIKCKPEEVVITQSVTDGINFVASGLKLDSKSNVITRGSNHEHPANHYPWLRLAKKVELRELPIDDSGYFELDLLKKTIDEKTGLVALSHALFNTGAILPVEEIGKILSEKNIRYFVDSAQTVGCITDVDVNKIKCDFMSFNGSKWLCGPMGTGIFYCKKESSELIEPLQVGGESEIFHDNTIVHKDIPDRFQAGFRNWVGAAGLYSSINYLLKIGIENIRRQNVKLASLLRDELSKITDVTLYGPEEEQKRTSIVSFSIKDKDTKTIVSKLEKEGMILAVREIFSNKVIRASPHFYNTESEILKVIESLKRI